MRKMTEDGEVAHLSLLSLSSLSPEGSNLYLAGTFCLSPGLGCLGLCGAAVDVGRRSLCSTCCTSLCTPSPTVGSYLYPSAHGLRGSDPSVHTALSLEEVASVRRGCGSGSRPVSETVTLTCRVLLLRVPPSLLPGTGEETAVSRSADTRKTLNESGISIVSVRNCARCVENKENGDKTGRESVNGIDWENKSKTVILIWIWILIWI